MMHSGNKIKLDIKDIEIYLILSVYIKINNLTFIWHDRGLSRLIPHYHSALYCLFCAKDKGQVVTL